MEYNFLPESFLVNGNNPSTQLCNDIDEPMTFEGALANSHVCATKFGGSRPHLFVLDKGPSP